MPQLTFTLNGEAATVDHDDGMHLLEVLREVCGVTSLKDGCAPQGTCGCCALLLDGRPTLSCLRPAGDVQGREVTTLEGLSDRERRVFAEAFVKDGAIQCGYCIPGIVTRAAALVRQGKKDRDEIARGLSGHLCRCTGYARILDAVEAAAEALDGGGDVRHEPRRPVLYATGEAAPLGDGVGRCSDRYRGDEHALGEKPYVADMTAEGMLHGAVVLAVYPRARVLGIDAAPALAMPGVARVLTADDVPGERFVGLIVKDWPVFVAVGETTHSVGDVLALVVADTQFRARQAAEKVAVGYEVLEPVTDALRALEPDSPQVHPSGNLLDTCKIRRGDATAALRESVHVVEATFTTQRIEHAFLEPEACLVVPQDGGLKVYTQGQGVHDDQAQIAAVLGVEPARLDVELVTNGGAFGGKEDLSIQSQTALAARLLGRPVRTVLTREQSIRVHPKRHPITLLYTVGADAEGRLTAVRARIVGDTGAYASVGAKVLERAAGHSCGPYKVPNVDVEARTVYTNNPPCGAMRGFGANQAAFAIEGVMDLLAERVGVDGYDIRERNLLGPGDAFATGQRMTASCGVRRTLEAVKGVYKAHAGRAGIACGIKNTGIGNGMDDSGRLKIRVRDGGRLEIVSGYTEMGQGLFTILRQVVCEETGLSPALMTVRTAADPDVVCGMTTASRATALLTAAGQQAARKLAADLNGGGLAALAGREYHGECVLDFTTKPGAGDADDPKTHVTFSYATQVVIVGADGKLERVVAAHDVGRAINPLLCAGQIEGSLHMGLGYALSEDLPCTGGRPDSLLLRDLGILKAKDTPPIDVILVEVPDEYGGYGSKGVGEIGLVPTAGAVAGALYAHDGVRRFSLPMTDAPAARASVPKSRRNDADVLRSSASPAAS
jgi:xanthine dehydrogenase molybdenum-binding subunit